MIITMMSHFGHCSHQNIVDSCPIQIVFAQAGSFSMTHVISHENPEASLDTKVLASSIVMSLALSRTARLHPMIMKPWQNKILIHILMAAC